MSKPARTLEFHADGDDENRVLGERVEIVAAQEGDHYVLSVNVEGSTAFQLDVTKPDQHHALEQIIGVLIYARDTGNNHGRAVETRKSQERYTSMRASAGFGATDGSVLGGVDGP